MAGQWGMGGHDGALWEVTEGGRRDETLRAETVELNYLHVEEGTFWGTREGKYGPEEDEWKGGSARKVEAAYEGTLCWSEKGGKC